MGAGDDDPAAGPDGFIDRLRRENTGLAGAAPAAATSAATLDAPSLPDSADGPVHEPGQRVGLSTDPPDESVTGDRSAGSSSKPPTGPPADRPIERSTDDDGGETSSAPGGETDGHDDASGTEPPRRLPPEARRSLISLMRQGVVLAARKVKVFETLVRHEGPIRAHLDELYLELVLDEPAGVAFIRNRAPGTPGGETEEAEDDTDDELDDGADGATLIARRTLSLYDTLLLLILRKHYQERQGAGEQRIVIDIERIESAFVPFLPLTVSERGERRQLNAALTRLIDKRLLARVRGDDERFEITPVIRYVVDAAFLDALLAEYERLAGGPNARSDAGPDALSDDPSEPLPSSPASAS